VRIGAVLAVALLAAVVAWFLVDRARDDSGSQATSTATTRATTSSTTGPAAATPVGPEIVAAKKLSSIANTLGHPVYWAGPAQGKVYEFTLTTSGRAYVRYLPRGAKAGDRRGTFLIVATYPFPKAYNALKRVSNGKDVKIPGGGIAVVQEGYPQSVHFAFPGVAYQGEVYDPSPEESLRVATSGDIQPVP